MQCEKIQDLLLTDHLDGRLAGAEQEKIASHLRDCARCREFAEIAEATLLAPFREAEQLTPPETVWQAVRQRIGAEPHQPANPLPKFLATLLTLPFTRPPALLFASVIALALVTALLLQQPSPDSGPRTVNLDQQIDYVAALLVAADDANKDEGFDTAIENYFL